MQRPRLLQVPDRAATLAEDALDLWYLTGRMLDPWQELSLDALFSVDSFGQWVCTEFGELVARQNGKGDILSPAELAHLYLWPKPNGEPKTIVHTAHQFKTAREAFLKLQRAIKSSPALIGEISRISTSHGEEGFELANGNRLLYLARSRNSGVGFTTDVLIIDEAQEMGQEALDALLPTMSAVENTQIIFTGTVPDELNNSEVWEGVRDRGRAGIDPRQGWIEFTPDGSDDPDRAAKINRLDPEVWAQANPGLGYRPGLATSIGDEALRMDPESFGRQRLSIWPNRRPEETVRLSELDLDVWRNTAGPEWSVGGDGAVIALALGRGGGYATIGKAVRVDSDQIAVEHHKTDRQTRWVVADVKALKTELGDALVVLDPKNAAPILSALDAAKIKYLPMNLDEIAAAHSQFIEYVNAGLVPHRDQPEVTKSLEHATTRPLGRAGFTWEPSDPAKPVSMAQVVTWALWGVLKSESTPRRQRPIVKGYA